MATRDPSRCGLPKGTGSAPHPCVGRSKGGACRDPCLCLDFKGSWALLKLGHAFHNQDMPNPSFVGFIACEPFLQGLRSAEFKANHAPLKAGQQGTGVVLIKQKRGNLKTRRSLEA